MRTAKLKRRKAKNPFKLIQVRIEAAKIYGRWQKRAQTDEEQVVDDEGRVRPKIPMPDLARKPRGRSG